MKKFIFLLILIISFICYSKELVFDDNGNIIDVKLDTFYSVHYKPVALISYDHFFSGYQKSLFILPQLDVNIGYATHWLIFLSVTHATKHLLTYGVFTGYSFKYDKLSSGVVLSVNFNF